MADDGLAVVDLLADLVEITHRLADQVAGGDLLDAYLLAAGAVQIVEDHLHRDTLSLRRAAEYLRDKGVPAAIPLILGWIATVSAIARAILPAERRSVRWCDEVARLRDGLARRVLSSQDFPGSRHAEQIALVGHLRDQVPALDGRLVRAVLRFPSCFRSFDQEPMDMLRLAGRYAARHPARDRPVLVLGVRTSGSYLAPLIAAALLSDGYTDVHVGTARPGHRLGTPVRRLLRSVAERGGRVAIVDDPPATGHTVESVAIHLTEKGFPEQAITLLLPLFDRELPEVLTTYDAIVLPFSEWTVHERLEPEALVAALSGVLPEPVLGVQRMPHRASAAGRGHVRAVYDVLLPDGECRRLVANGAGLGYFGRHALAVARAMPDYLPRTYGFANGLVFRDWLSGDQRLSTAGVADAPRLAEYVGTRATALPVGTDRSARLAGRQPAWEAASRVLQRGYGRIGVLLRPILLDPLMRHLCAVGRPSVVDGATGLSNWFRDGSSLYKVDADVRDFANTDLACYDRAYDLAGIDPGSRDSDFVESLRKAMPCDGERFVLYELVHLWDQEREGRPAHRASARAVQRYVAARLLTGLQIDPDGPLCALDIDGVLESDALDFPILTPLAAMCLRALITHGYRPVLVTGRSLDEVRERCEAYGVAGGTAEYGSVAFDHTTGTTRELVPPADRRILDHLRETLGQTQGVFVDEDYQRIVRAYQLTSDGRRRPLPASLVRRMLDDAVPGRGRVRVVEGDGQSDFVADVVDKGVGLRALADMLGVTESAERIAFAVGDAGADIPMLRMASLALAPANADKRVRASGVPVLRRAYAAGLAQAVAKLLGHQPGSCAQCRRPRQTPRSHTLLALLDAQRAGARGLPAAIARGLLRLPRTTP
jgi:hydroxymethylpyrimidine pyrophosphatase-like HAD family hydrolase